MEGRRLAKTRTLLAGLLAGVPESCSDSSCRRDDVLRPVRLQGPPTSWTGLTGFDALQERVLVLPHHASAGSAGVQQSDCCIFYKDALAARSVCSDAATLS